MRLYLRLHLHGKSSCIYRQDIPHIRDMISQSDSSRQTRSRSRVSLGLWSSRTSRACTACLLKLIFQRQTKALDGSINYSLPLPCPPAICVLREDLGSQILCAIYAQAAHTCHLSVSRLTRGFHRSKLLHSAGSILTACDFLQSRRHCICELGWTRGTALRPRFELNSLAER